MANDVILKGARGIREIVVRPFHTVDWLLFRAEARTVIYADAGSIFVFDLEMRVLHQVMFGQYSYASITRVWRQGRYLNIRIRMNTKEQFVLGLMGGTTMTLEVWEHLMELTEMHPPTQQRIADLRPDTTP